MAALRYFTCLDALFHMGLLPVNALLQAQHVLLLLLGIPLILAVVSCTDTRAVDWQPRVCSGRSPEIALNAPAQQVWFTGN